MMKASKASRTHVFGAFLLQRPQLEVICLVPELCSLTGLTDNIKQDFRVMKVRQVRVGNSEQVDLSVRGW